MKRKITDGEFDAFKFECIRLQKEWGLLEYTLYFDRHNDSEVMAMATVYEEDCVATIKLAKVIKNPDDMPPITLLAKHEMIHLLINRLEWVGKKKYGTEAEIDLENERLTVKLEKIL